MTEWRWISLELAHAVHDRQLAEHGGLEGIKDIAAAAYCWGIVRNHGYSDGNKRTGWILGRLFLADHGIRVQADPGRAVVTVERVAAGRVTQDELAQWFRDIAIA